MLVGALPRDPAEYRRNESIVLGPKPRTKKMIGMISGASPSEHSADSLGFAQLKSGILALARYGCWPYSGWHARLQ